MKRGQPHFKCYQKFLWFTATRAFTSTTTLATKITTTPTTINTTASRCLTVITQQHSLAENINVENLRRIMSIMFVRPHKVGEGSGIVRRVGGVVLFMFGHVRVGYGPLPIFWLGIFKTFFNVNVCCNILTLLF